MTKKNFLYIFCLFFIISFSGTMGWSQEIVIVSSKVGECELSVESNEKWQTLRLRAHHPKYKGCHITRDDMLRVLERAFSKSDSPKIEGNYSSLFIGRLIDYPWLSQYLATNAYHDAGWDLKKGKPAVIDINKYVSQVLFRKELIAQIEAPFSNGGYRIFGVTVEKVLVGGLREVPLYEGKIFPGKVPYDAQVWFRLKKN